MSTGKTNGTPAPVARSGGRASPAPAPAGAVHVDATESDLAAQLLRGGLMDEGEAAPAKDENDETGFIPEGEAGEGAPEPETDETEQNEPVPSELEEEAKDGEGAGSGDPDYSPEGEDGDENEPEEGEEGTAGLNLPKAVQEAVNRRIGKVVARRKEAEAKLAETEAALAAAEARAAELEAQPAKAPATAANPLAEIETLADLNAKAAEAEGVASRAAELLDSVEDDPAAVEEELKGLGVKIEFTPVEMRKFLRRAKANAEKVLTTHIPARKEYLQQAAEASRQAAKLIPELANPKSPLAVEAAKVLRTLPELKRFPHYRFASGIYALGLQAYQARRAAAKAPAKTPAPPPKLPGARKPAAAALPRKAAAEAAARKRLEETGSQSALAAVIAQDL